MTSRERWTIYPLLFLALGISLRDKITSTVDLRSITCEVLSIVDHEGKQQLRLTSGQMVLSGADGEPLVEIGNRRLTRRAASGSAGELRLFGAKGHRLVTVGANPEVSA